MHKHIRHPINYLIKRNRSLFIILSEFREYLTHGVGWDHKLNGLNTAVTDPDQNISEYINILRPLIKSTVTEIEVKLLDKTKTFLFLS